MTIAALILIPLIAGVASFWLPSRSGRRAILLLTAVVHCGLTASLWNDTPEPTPGVWLGIDTLGLLFLTIVSGLFFATAVYSIGYLQQEEATRHTDREEGFLFTNRPEAVFICCMMLFLAAMTLVTLSQHFGLLWVGIEATTLASAPLIYFHRHHRSLEATWKYLMICSVGIALALLGNFLLSVAAWTEGDGEVQLTIGNLLANASRLDHIWLQVAFLFFLVGYGTKMGLVPLHTWLPDAHSEAPSPVSALLSGALLNCAFLGILRVHQLCVAAGEADFSRSLLVLFGLLSMAVAAVFIIRQADFKRMLAYSSVEHMGILALGVGLGGAGVFGAMYHAFNHSLTKAALFLTAGNILAAYRTKNVNDVTGVGRLLPLTGVLWMAGFLAITGSPPFGTFLSEFTILKAALDGGQVGVAVLYLVLLAMVFVGMAGIFLRMTQGKMPTPAPNGARNNVLTLVSPVVLLTAALVLGLALPERLEKMFREVGDSFTETELSNSVLSEPTSHERKPEDTANDQPVQTGRSPFSPANAFRLHRYKSGHHRERGLTETDHAS